MSRNARVHDDRQADIALACIGLMLADMVARLSERTTLDELLEMTQGVQGDVVSEDLPSRREGVLDVIGASANSQGQRLRVVG